MPFVERKFPALETKDVGVGNPVAMAGERPDNCYIHTMIPSKGTLPARNSHAE